MSDVLIRVEGHAGRITLNRPRALNALTLPMVQAIDAALHAWQDDDRIKLVMVDGAGERGLCAGGDIRALYDAAISGDLSFPKAFFAAEYRMNARIAAYPKPYVALMDGIVMGGGIGISAHGSVRIVTEKSRLAMPETGIGFMPDVGGTWLLARAPHHFGLHAALTAGQMNAADAIACGLACSHVPSASLAALADDIAACETPAEITTAISRSATEPAPGVFEASKSWMEKCYAGADIEQILGLLDQHAPETAAAIRSKSPIALHVTLRAIREAARLGSLNACLEQEFRLVMAFMTAHDFREGVRAAVVDKDRNPRWNPATLADVRAADIDQLFTGSNFGGLGLATGSETNDA